MTYIFSIGFIQARGSSTQILNSLYFHIFEVLVGLVLQLISFHGTQFHYLFPRIPHELSKWQVASL